MGAIAQFFRDLYLFRELLWAMTWRDIRIKYKQAAMGILWVFFVPFLVIMSGVFIRVGMAMYSGNPVDPAVISAVIIKSLPWILFMNAISAASQALIGNTSLVTKIYFPREVIPTATVLSSLFDFLLAGVAVFLVLVLMPNSQVVYSWNLLWVPVCFLLLVVFTAALGLLLSCANLFFRDVKYIVQVLLRYGIFFTPVYFSVHEMGALGKAMMINPLSPMFEVLAAATLEGSVPTDMLMFLAYSALWAFGGFALALVIFEKAEYLFAEYV
jgi:lipopolysaccharide transport system permease protein